MDHFDHQKGSVLPKISKRIGDGFALFDKQNKDIDQVFVNMVAEKKKTYEKSTVTPLPNTLVSAYCSRKPNTKLKNYSGWLWKRSKNLIGDWKRRWFILKDGLLLYFSNPNDLLPAGQVNVLLSTVKNPSPEEVQRVNCFEIVSPQVSYMLQAESFVQYKEWSAALLNCLTDLLTKQTSRKTLNRMKSFVDPNDIRKKTFRLKDPSVLFKVDGNSLCADCGAENPDWASINLGILVCIGCSGIHRRLGVHISKVRSLTLDACWDPNLLNLMQKIGNNFSNRIYEALDRSGLPPKPGPVDPEGDLGPIEKYIKTKYQYRAFVDHLPRIPNPCNNYNSYEEMNENPPKQQPNIIPLVSRQLIVAVQSNKIEQIVHCLALGADVNWKTPKLGKSPLHKAVSTNNVLAAEILIQYSAHLDVTDSRGRTPLHYSVFNDRGEMTKLLIRRGASIDAKDSNGRTPSDIAFATIPETPVVEEIFSLHTQALLSKNNSSSSLNSKNSESSLSPLVSSGKTSSAKVDYSKGVGSSSSSTGSPTSSPLESTHKVDYSQGFGSSPNKTPAKKFQFKKIGSSSIFFNKRSSFIRKPKSKKSSPSPEIESPDPPVTDSPKSPIGKPPIRKPSDIISQSRTRSSSFNMPRRSSSPKRVSSPLSPSTESDEIPESSGKFRNKFSSLKDVGIGISRVKTPPTSKKLINRSRRRAPSETPSSKYNSLPSEYESGVNLKSLSETPPPINTEDDEIISDDDNSPQNDSQNDSQNHPPRKAIKLKKPVKDSNATSSLSPRKKRIVKRRVVRRRSRRPGARRRSPKSKRSPVVTL